MLRINCPWCGPRDEIEFRCGGQSHIVRPSQDATDQDWTRYLFERENPRGIHRERWVHAAGCRRWFNIARDTATHRIAAVYRIDEGVPSIDPAGSAP